MTDRIICGWRVRSALPLPETLPWPGADDPVDIDIRRGAVPKQVGQRNADVSYIEVAHDGRLLVDASPVCRFLVTRDSVVVDTRLAPEATDWRAYLLGPVLAVICYLRGVLPVHACCVRVGRRTVAIAGKSGAGKSSLAAALALRGHRLISDDICACFGLPTQALVLPTYPALKLSRETLQALCVGSDSLAPIGPDFEKFQWLRAQGFDPTPVALNTVYLIEDAGEGARDEIVVTDGAEAFTRLSTEIYRPPIGRLLLAKTAFFAMATQLTAAITVRRLIRRSDLSRLKALAAMIEDDAMRT